MMHEHALPQKLELLNVEFGDKDNINNKMGHVRVPLSSPDKARSRQLKIVNR